MKKLILFFSFSLYSVLALNAQQVDYSVVSVPEETGLSITRITTDNDCVVLPIVSRKGRLLNWFSNKVIQITPDGKSVAYIAARNNATNIFVKDLSRQGSSIQRTNRNEVIDFSYSPDGKIIYFSEHRGDEYQLFQTDANSGFICRQISSGSQDFTPVYDRHLSQIFFARQEKKNVSIWSYDIKSHFLSSYTSGMNPCPLQNETAYLCSRMGPDGKGEIWKINYESSVEECIVSDINRGFSSPSISPDGQWILLVGESILKADKFEYHNTDIYVCRTDGTQLTQLTFHAADDLSPTWSADGKTIYFISQRGSSEGVANIWKMDFLVY